MNIHGLTLIMFDELDLMNCLKSFCGKVATLMELVNDNIGVLLLQQSHGGAQNHRQRSFTMLSE